MKDIENENAEGRGIKERGDGRGVLTANNAVLPIVDRANEGQNGCFMAQQQTTQVHHLVHQGHRMSLRFLGRSILWIPLYKCKNEGMNE